MRPILIAGSGLISSEAVEYLDGPRHQLVGVDKDARREFSQPPAAGTVIRSKAPYMTTLVGQ